MYFASKGFDHVLKNRFQIQADFYCLLTFVLQGKAYYMRILNGLKVW